MYGAYGFGQGYFGQGPLGGTTPILVLRILVLETIATVGAPIEAFAAALTTSEFLGFYDVDIDSDASRG